MRSLNMQKQLLVRQQPSSLSWSCNQGSCRLCVKRISPDTAIHEQNGYAKLLYHKYNILMSNVDNDNSDKTYTNMHEV